MVINVPVIESADVLLLGGSIAGLRTALALAEKGYKVFASFPRSYCADDAAATLDFLSMEPDPEIAPDPSGVLPSPMMVKRTWERRLMAAGVKFLYQTFPVRRMEDKFGNFAGMVIAGRSGFMAVQAKVMIDGTDFRRGSVASGAPERPFVPGDYMVERILVGSSAPRTARVKQKELHAEFEADGKKLKLYRASFPLWFERGDYAERCAAEVKMRLRCWSPDQKLAADSCIFHLPDAVPADFRPDGRYPFLAPEDLKGALKLLKSLPGNEAEVIPGAVKGNPEGAAVRFHNAPRYAKAKKKLSFHLNSLPHLFRYDVVVAGGGTGGAPAAIGAVRESARVLCLENSAHLGGITTQGRIAHYWYGNRVGFTASVDDFVAKMGEEGGFPADACKWNIEWKQHYFLRAASRGEAVVWFNTLAVGALRWGDLVCGVLAATPDGCGAIDAAAVIDATGNAEIASAAGAECSYSGEMEPALQGSGVPRAVPDVHYANCDYLFADDSDTLDATAAYVMGREKYQQMFDLCTVIGTRERQRIKGEIELQPTDFLLGRCYSDTIVEARSNFDTHGFTIHPMFLLHPTDEEPLTAKVPYRCLLPRKLDGILVTGLGISAHRDAMPVVRMEADVQNQGFAAGLAAGMTAVRNKTVRMVNIKELQRTLCTVGILSPEIMQEGDGFSAENAVPDFREIAEVFRDPETSVPELEAEFRKKPSAEKAALLAMLDSSIGRKELIRAIGKKPWDEGWNYRGMGQFGRAVSPLDAAILALARIADGSEKEIVLKKLEMLKPESEFSHFRALCNLLRRSPCSEAAPKLRELLKTPELANTIPVTLEELIGQTSPEPNDNQLRNRQLKELYLLKALKACDRRDSLAERRLKKYEQALEYLYAGFAGNDDSGKF